MVAKAKRKTPQLTKDEAEAALTVLKFSRKQCTFDTWPLSEWRALLRAQTKLTVLTKGP